MRVKMAYSVELEEIPAETKRLLGELKEWYEELQPVVSKIDRLDTEFFTRTEIVREKLIGIDARLDDCVSLVQGYNEAVTNLKKQAAEDNQQEAPNDEEIQEG